MTTQVSDDLLRACDGRVEPAGDDDALLGIRPRWVASPASTEETAALMRVVARDGLAVTARGSGTRLRWGGRPERLDLVVDTSRIDALVEHAAGDLVYVAGAGRSLARVQEDVGGAGQRLGIDPPTGGTLGGAVATAASGPLRLHHGAVRDLVIGMTLVRADGVVAHSGGKVVKNVAGYDLAKLLTGSFGTLGLITQVALRLHPVPQGRRWVTASVADAAAAGAAVLAVAHSQLVPSAVELDVPVSDAGSSGPGGPGAGAGPREPVGSAGPAGSLSVLVEGHPDGATESAQRVADLLAASGGADVLVGEDPPSWWGDHVAADRPGCTLLRVTHVLTGVTPLLRVLTEAAAGSGVRAHLRGSPAVGVEHVAVEGDSDAVAALVQRLRVASAGFDGQVVVLDAPDDVRDRVDLWVPIQALGLMRAVKDRFDPGRLLSPGRFVGGI
ncbi:FAD-binding oxidoreductase [Pedococcus sp. NPDC057267]|uniref:FAD-binding oxidoreductase n=1 Tax=Pedococcus sp. NPDC057267 TaxID=3346077 RepID=UPI003638C405